MDFYPRKVNQDEPRVGACLNGDTAIKSSLQCRLDLPDCLCHSESTCCYNYFDTTGAGGACGSSTGHGHNIPLAEYHVPLLYLPLPMDFPARVNKDLLIYMAAYEGNVDRYARQRRPFVIQGEANCIIQGFCHNTTLAKWLLQEVHGAWFDAYIVYLSI